MRVLHITNNYPTNQNPIFGIFVKEQIESLTGIGTENDVYFINGRENGKLEYLRSIFRLHKLLKRKHFDIVHCHHAFSAICFILSGHSTRFKSIVSYQNDPKNEQGKKIFNFVRKYTNAVILKNNSSIIDNTSIFNQPNGVNTNLFHPIERDESVKKLNLDPQKEYILFASSNFIRNQKRYDRFLKTLEILKNRYGVTNVEELKLINVERNLVPFYFNAASIHLLTSDFEGSPNSVKEAMACNIPVVSTNVGNVSELLTGVNGSFVSKSDTPDELAKLTYNALFHSGQLNSREILLSKNLDIDSVANNIFLIYNKIINE